MGRPKIKDNKSVSARLDVETIERLDDFCERSGQSKTTAIERAIIAYIDDYDRKQALLAKLDE